MEIRPLNGKEYKHKEYEFLYETSGYYDLKINDISFQFIYKSFEKNQRRSFKDELFAD